MKTPHPTHNLRYLGRTLRLLVAAVGLAAPRPATAGPPYITDDPEPVDLGHWEAYVFSAGAHGSGDTNGLGPSMEVNYGALPNLQLHILGGFAYDAAPGHPACIGPSDTELGFKFRFINTSADDWWPEVATFPAIELPSGNAAHGLGAGHTQAFFPVWLEKDFGKWTTYGGAGYWINPGAGNHDYWFAGWVLQRHLTDTLAVGAEFFYQTSYMTGRPPSTGFNLGVVYDLSEHYHLLFSAGKGGILYAVDTAASPDPLTYYLGLQWTF